jgi:hypothetical protein
MEEIARKETWLSVRGQEFSEEEARDAADFRDVLSYFCVTPENLEDFIGDRQLQVGHRLFLAETLPVDKLGPVLMGEDDNRVCAIAKMRCEEAMRGDRQIILPWE